MLIDTQTGGQPPNSMREEALTKTPNPAKIAAWFWWVVLASIGSHSGSPHPEERAFILGQITALGVDTLADETSLREMHIQLYS
jgi:hypothetical protein